jgi:phosphate ABC transporter permease protein PstC
VLEFLFGTRWVPQLAPPSYGVIPLVTATAWTTIIALLVAVPFGLGAAIFLAEYAHPNLRKVLKPILEILAGVPTVVYGFFALTFVQGTVIREWLQLETGAFSVLAAGLVMGVMIIPTVASISEDSMSAVPNALRQGSAALGANRMQTTLRVVFPAALSGIVAAIVLGISRAVGETMIVAIAAGNQARIVTGPLELGQTMTGFIANTALGDSRVGSLEYNTLFAVGLLLFAITLLINFISIRFVRRFREVY